MLNSVQWIGIAEGYGSCLRKTGDLGAHSRQTSFADKPRFSLSNNLSPMKSVLIFESPLYTATCFLPGFPQLVQCTHSRVTFLPRKVIQHALYRLSFRDFEMKRSCSMMRTVAGVDWMKPVDLRWRMDLFFRDNSLDTSQQIPTQVVHTLSNVSKTTDIVTQWVSAAIEGRHWRLQSIPCNEIWLNAVAVSAFRVPWMQWIGLQWEGLGQRDNAAVPFS
jgi:hypothetical protein